MCKAPALYTTEGLQFCTKLYSCQYCKTTKVNTENLSRPGACPIHQPLEQQQGPSFINKLEYAKLFSLTAVLRFGSEKGCLEEIPHFCFTTLFSNILACIGMGEKIT